MLYTLTFSPPTYENTNIDFQRYFLHIKNFLITNKKFIWGLLLKILQSNKTQLILHVFLNVITAYFVYLNVIFSEMRTVVNIRQD